MKLKFIFAVLCALKGVFGASDGDDIEVKKEICKISNMRTNLKQCVVLLYTDQAVDDFYADFKGDDDQYGTISVFCERGWTPSKEQVEILTTLKSNVLEITPINEINCVFLLDCLAKSMDKGTVRCKQIQFNGSMSTHRYDIKHQFVTAATKHKIAHNVSVSEILGLVGLTGETFTPLENVAIDMVPIICAVVFVTCAIDYLLIILGFEGGFAGV